MRKMLLALSLAVLAVGLVATASATTAKTVGVSITKKGFVPKTVTMNIGDSIKWTNNDTVNHQVACQKCPFTSPVIKPGGSFTRTFKIAGKFLIRDPLHSKIKGSVTVNATKTVSLTATPSVVKYLQPTMLSGRVGNGKSNENVVILGRACGQTVFTHVASVKTTSGGAYTLTQKPTMNTVYEAKWNTSTSKEISVHVRPRIKLSKVGTHKFKVRLKAAQSFVGKHVLFQKQTPAGGWVKVKRVTLKKLTISGTTDITTATFKSSIKHGLKVRALVKSKQVGPCYIGNHSSSITS